LNEAQQVQSPVYCRPCIEWLAYEAGQFGAYADGDTIQTIQMIHLRLRSRSLRKLNPSKTFHPPTSALMD